VARPSSTPNPPGVYSMPATAETGKIVVLLNA
jgi:hypothetical protein